MWYQPLRSFIVDLNFGQISVVFGCNRSISCTGNRNYNVIGRLQFARGGSYTGGILSGLGE